MYIGIHVKYPLFLSDFNETWIFSIDFFKKFLNTKFHENPSSGNRVSIVRPARDRQMSVELKEMYREKLKY